MRFLPGHEEEMLNSALDFVPMEVEMDIPPELIGGTSSPAPVENQEWVEGKKKDGRP
jgi:protein TonB